MLPTGIVRAIYFVVMATLGMAIFTHYVHSLERAVVAKQPIRSTHTYPVGLAISDDVPF